MVERETMEFDVVIVGAGPAGLSAAIKLAQQAQEKQKGRNAFFSCQRVLLIIFWGENTDL